MGANNPKTFSVLSAWQEYEENFLPKGKRMTHTRYRELKMAFYAAYGACIVTMRDEIAHLAPARVWSVLDALIKEIQNFSKTRTPEEIMGKEKANQPKKRRSDA